MLPYYDKHTVEVLITEARASALFKAVEGLQTDHTALVSGTLAAFGGRKYVLSQRMEYMRSWLAATRREEFVVDAIVPHDGPKYVIVLAIKDMSSLGTEFGKRHRGKRAGYIVAYAFGSTPNLNDLVHPIYSRLQNGLKRYLRLKRPPRLDSIATINETFNKLKKKRHSTPQIPEELASLFHTLKDNNLRSVLRRTKQAKDPTLGNIAKSAGLRPAIVKTILTRGLRKGLLTREYNVRCQHCLQVLARVSSKAALSQMVQHEVSCPGCRSKLTKRSYEHCYRISSPLEAMMDGSKWMGMLVRHALHPYGLGRGVITEVVDGPNELDLVANMDGSLLLMELKDDRFSIGHAYSFVGKCSQYKPATAAIVASGGVDTDVKEYIANTGMEARYIESLERLEEGIVAMLSARNVAKLAELVSLIPWDYLLSKGLVKKFGHSFKVADELSRAFGRRPRLPTGLTWPE